MTILWFKIQPMDVTLFRDGRPFTAGESSLALSLFPPSPASVTGALRTFIGKEVLGGTFAGLGDADSAPFQVIGPIPCVRENQLFFPWPEDLQPPEKKSLPAEGRRNRTYVFRRKLVKFPPFIRQFPKIMEYALLLTPTKENTKEPSFIEQFDTEGKKWVDFQGLLAWQRGDSVYSLTKSNLQMVTVESRPGIRTIPSTKTTDPEGGAFFFVHMNRYQDDAGFIIGVRKNRCDDSLWSSIQSAFSENKAHLLHLGGERHLAQIRQINPPGDYFDKVEYLKNQVRLLLMTPAYVETSSMKNREIPVRDYENEYTFTLLTLALADGNPLYTGWDYRTQTPKKHRKLIPAGSVLVGKVQDIPSIGWLGSFTSLGFGCFIAIAEPGGKNL